jgi:CRISPR-associated protein Csb1
MVLETVDQLYASGAVALSLKETLRPVSGNIIFPPTYAPPQGAEKRSAYDISQTRNGKICSVDSLGSQANRMEAVFLEPGYRHLVPQVSVKAGEQVEANLLIMGHRLADAAIRFSDLHDRITEAFLAFRDKGNAAPIAKIGPTSLVFGVWDSRETHAKIPRLINSIIRAYDVEELTRSAQYFATFKYQDVGFGEKDKKDASMVGLADAPSAGTHGGILVHGQILREAQLNMSALMSLRGSDDQETDMLRRYVLGLALVAMLAPRVHDLRQGCLLVSDQENPGKLQAINSDGSTHEAKIPFENVLAFANESAGRFGVGGELKTSFDPKKAREAMKKKLDDIS